MPVLPVTNHYPFLVKLAEQLGWDVVGDVQRDRHLDSAPVEILLVSYYALAKFQRRRFWHDSFISIRWYFAFEKKSLSQLTCSPCASHPPSSRSRLSLVRSVVTSSYSASLKSLLNSLRKVSLSGALSRCLPRTSSSTRSEKTKLHICESKSGSLKFQFWFHGPPINLT